MALDWLNYHHLLYFWTVAREGSVARAAERLHLAQPTVSGQLRTLERSLGHPLFRKRGRGLELTEAGRVALRYAEEIFGLGRELRQALRVGGSDDKPLRLAVGVAEALPKLVVYRLLEPALRLDRPVALSCVEGSADGLLADLARHALDLVLTDEPPGSRVAVRSFHHQLGECGITIFGEPALADRLGLGDRPFPAGLDGAPMLLPTHSTALRRALDTWLDANDLSPNVVGEFADSALLKAFGQAGAGLFAAPRVIEEEVCRQYRVRVVGRVEAIRERFYAVTVERRLKHPAALAISESARRELFAPR